uniref:COG1470 family protein n=1 Tax=Prevotella sp. TaxID=59823 RepID=UPI004028698E
MKRNKFIYLLAFSAVMLLGACSELSDKDYFKNIETTVNSDELVVVDMSSEEYLSKEPEYSSINELFKSHGIFTALEQKNQLSTMLVVENSDFQAPAGKEAEIDNAVKAHVSDIAVSPANLKTEGNNMRIMMWHGKYINVDLDDAARNEGKIAGHIMFGTSAVKKVVKTNSGYIYVLSSLLNIPKSIYDYITNLDDNYSILRDSILASGTKEFDKKNSKPIGVNDEGNTVYDSVFIYKNTHFLEKNFDLSSESLTATLLLTSNAVVEEAIADAKVRLQKWGLWDEWNAERQYNFEYTMRHWIMDAAFFDKKLTPETLQSKDEENDMLTSIFSKYWKTSVQQINPTPIELSNGIAYQVTRLHIPNNVLIWRLKEDFSIYEFCSAEQKESFFQMLNMQFKACTTAVAAWTPLQGVWPKHECRTLDLTVGDDASGDWQLVFTPCKRIFETYPTRMEMVKKDWLKSNLTVTGIKPFLIPPGKYTLSFGSKQNQNMEITFKVRVKGSTDVVAVSDPITLGSTTTFHYDRNPGNFIEGYDPSTENLSTNKKAGNYDTDGGTVISELEIPDVKGDGSPVEITIEIASPTWNGNTTMVFNHWCLRPTKDNY